ncbi:MAG: hypothetical protein H7A04_17875 [Pseudomonadales bacterium]|nr:hypothetical protein [Pseudomonadales bacterium]MCP5348723.1 hypothetical protein [Pseudomonadales bacterium]
MNWDAIGAVGEIVGALGVVASLFYVAYQVRQNTIQGRFNTDAVNTANAEALSNVGNGLRMKLAENEALADLFIKGQDDPGSLTKSETIRFRAFLSAILHSSQVAFEAYLRGINKSQWDASKVVVCRVLSTPGGQWLWDEFSDDFTEEFRNEVNRLIAEGSIQFGEKLK